MRSLALFIILATAQGLSAASYYTAKTGRDANPGTLTAPFLTIRKGASVLRPGDTLYVRAGTYAEGLRDAVPSGTSWGSAVTIAAYPGERVVMAPASGGRVFEFGRGSYIVLDGLVLDARNVTNNGIKITNPAHHIRVRNSEIMNAPQMGILVGTDCNYNEFIGLKIHNNGSRDLDHGIYINGSNNLVERCDVHTNSGTGVQIYTGYSGRRASNNIIRYNKIHGNSTMGRERSAITLTSGENNTAHNNLIWNNGAGIAATNSAIRAKIYNNTIYKNSGAGITLTNASGANGGGPSSGGLVRNNIIFANGSAISNAQPGAVVTNNLTSDPLFVSASASDFKLRSASPAIDKGYNLSSEGITRDVAGNARPSGAGYDIGAYEYAGVAPAPTPTPAPAPAPAGPGCVSAPALSWRNISLPAQTGTFTLTFDATPSQARMDGIIGLSYGAASTYTQLLPVVRFNNAGRIDARNGTSYTAAASIPYLANTAYRFRLVVDRAAKTYSIWVREGGGSERVVGSNYAFRAGQTVPSAFNNLGVYSTAGAQSVCNAAVSSAGEAPPAPAPPGCASAPAQAWKNVSLPAQTGRFTLTFDATPSQARMDGIIGLSYGPASTYTQLLPVVRFNNAGRIDARNGTSYTAAASIPYLANTAYRFRLDVDRAAKTYSIWVRQGSEAERLLGSGYAFRSGQTVPPAFNNLGMYSTAGAQSVCNAAVSSAGGAPPASAPPGCASAPAQAWKNVSLPAQTGRFTLTFDATPSRTNMDGIIGLSNGAASTYTQLLPVVRFNNTGRIDARNGASYAAAANIPYMANTAYRFRLIVDRAARTYTAYVRQGSEAEKLLGSNYAFRSGVTVPSSFNNLGIYSTVGAQAVCNAAVSAAPAAGDVTPPVITAVAATALSAGGATIVWTTNEPADSLVDYGPTTAYGQTKSVTTLLTSHGVPLTGLSAGTLYHYRVKSKDAAGNLSASSDLTFATAAPAPTGAGCVTSANSWKNAALPARTGSLTVEFDATPAAASIDGVVGLSNGPASSWASLAAAVRFNTSGRIDARSGGTYAAGASIPYAAKATYHFRLVVNLSARTYTAYVRQGGAAEQLIGANYPFRTEQRAVTTLNNLGVFASIGSATVCSAVVR